MGIQVADALVKFLGDYTSVDKGLLDIPGKAEAPARKVGDLFHFSIGGAIKAGFGALAGAAGGLAAISQPFIEAQNRLKLSIENTGQSYDELKPKIEAATASAAKYGHGSVEVMGTVEKMTVAWGDSKKAIAELPFLMDLAAYKHISLADAAALDIKMHAGNAKAYKEFGINIKEASKLALEADKAKSADTASTHALGVATQNLADLEARLADKSKMSTGEQIALRNATDAVAKARLDAIKHPQALAAAEQHLADVQRGITASAKLTISDEQALRKAREAVTAATQDATTKHNDLTAAMDNQKKGGADLAKGLEQVAHRTHGYADAMANTWQGRLNAMKVTAINFIQSTGAGIGNWAIVWATATATAVQVLDSQFIKGLLKAVPGILGFTAAEEGATGVQWAFNASLLANPIFLVVAGLALLVGGLIYAYTHVEGFRKFVDAAFAKLKEFGGFIQDHVMPVVVALAKFAFAYVSTEISILIAVIGWLWDHTKGLRDFLAADFHPTLVVIQLAIKALGWAFGEVGDYVAKAWKGMQVFFDWISHNAAPILDGLSKGLDKAAGFMKMLDPTVKHSPSLVDNVVTGTEIIKRRYMDLSGISIQGPQIGGIRAGLQGAAAAALGGGSAGGNGGGGTFRDIIIQGDVRDQPTVLDLGRQLAWQAKTR